MFTTRKFVALLWLVYAGVVVLPAPFVRIDTVPQGAVDTAVLACLAFLAGATFMVLARASNEAQALALRPIGLSDLERLLAYLTVAIAAYVAMAGPPSPFFHGVADSFELALAREDAVKLNADEVFVRVYSWGRDLFAPTLFVIGVDRLVSSRLKAAERWVLMVGMGAALYLALWSGQKATIVNFAIAAFVFRAISLKHFVATGFRVIPILLGLVLGMFVVTQPEIFTGGDAALQAVQVLATSILNRVVLAPLTVAASYVHAIDDLKIIAPLDVIPYLSFLWTPWILSIENEVALEFFHQGVDSGHANALAFAYAYVLAGYAGCFFGGALSVAAVETARRIVRLPQYADLGRVFDALLCYMVLDLMNGNFLAYSLKIVVLALAASSAAFVMNAVRSNAKVRAARSNRMNSARRPPPFSKQGRQELQGDRALGSAGSSEH
jgi:hypothetical protein